MEAEHCAGPGSTHSFTTRNYGITTCPSKEWGIVVGSVECPPGGDRCVPRVGELLGSRMSREAKLVRAEVIAVVLYSGPMVSRQRGPGLPVVNCR